MRLRYISAVLDAEDHRRKVVCLQTAAVAEFPKPGLDASSVPLVFERMADVAISRSAP